MVDHLCEAFGLFGGDLEDLVDGFIGVPDAEQDIHLGLELHELGLVEVPILLIDREYLLGLLFFSVESFEDLVGRIAIGFVSGDFEFIEQSLRIDSDQRGLQDPRFMDHQTHEPFGRREFFGLVGFFDQCIRLIRERFEDLSTDAREGFDSAFVLDGQGPDGVPIDFVFGERRSAGGISDQSTDEQKG